MCFLYQPDLLFPKSEILQCHNLQVSRIEREFSSYKVRAHALLQRKDAELTAARDNEQLKVLEEALRVSPSGAYLVWIANLWSYWLYIQTLLLIPQEAEKEILLLSAEKDKAAQDLKDALANHVEELAVRW